MVIVSCVNLHIKLLGEAWVFRLWILMFLLVVGHLILPICTHKLGTIYQFLSYGQLNTSFSDQGFELHSNSYTPNRNNHSDVSWYALASGNYALQSDELHHLEYLQFSSHSSLPSSYNHPPQESLVQHFPTAHIDDLEERSNQLMTTRCAHTQPPHTHAPH